ncbi:MAG: YcaO-like family protein [Bdellovibrionales bacterium]|nr:YcaO-like family protein [Bdellovibrionales bacterium]
MANEPDFFVHEEGGVHSVLCGQSEIFCGSELVGVGFSRSSDLRSAQEEAALISSIEIAERRIVQRNKPLDSHGRGSTARRSFSNGVAAALTAESARKRARFELIERHRVLWAWYSGIPPRKLNDAYVAVGLPQSSEWTWSAYDFGQGVSGVFGFPTSASTRRVPVFGFACDETTERSVVRAKKEAFQRWMMLNDLNLEPLPSKVLPTPDFQQDLFLTREGLRLIFDWLNGNATWSFDKTIKEFFSHKIQNGFEYQFLGSEKLEKNFRIEVWRAEHQRAIPLIFGYDHESPFFKKLISECPTIPGLNTVGQLLSVGLLHPIG